MSLFQAEIKKKSENNVRGIIGPEPTDDKSIRILNRVIEWTQDGIEYEADQRHAEIIIRDAGLDSSAKTAITPRVKTAPSDKPIEEKEFSSTQSTMYPAISARGNYRSPDRSGIPFFIKELSRKMSRPNESD